jgi:hypothetical protein
MLLALASRLTKRRAAAASGWWLSGGISAANCLAAYQPKGAASLAASYVNLANSGTYDLTTANAPTWAEATGWTFNGTSAHLLTGITSTLTAGTGSILCRFADADTNNAVILGARNSAGTDTRYYLIPWYAVDDAAYGLATLQARGSRVTTGTMAIAGLTPYLDGSPNGANLSGTPFAMGAGLAIGALNTAGSLSNYCAAKVYAVAVYAVTITADQVAAVTTAAGAL